MVKRPLSKLGLARHKCTIERLIFDRRLSWLVGIIVLVLVALLPWIQRSAFVVEEASVILIYALIIGGLNVAYGYAGELALGQIFMFAVGAYIGGYLDIHGQGDILIDLIAGGVGAGLIGLIAGLPGLRVGRYAFAMVSFFLIIILPNVTGILSSETGGSQGMVGIQSPTIFGLSINSKMLLVVIAVIVAAWYGVIRNIRYSPIGDQWRIVKADFRLAESLGIAVNRVRLEIYVIAAISAGVGGVLFSYLYQVVFPASFSLTEGISIFAGGLIGGAESIYGSLIGGLFVQGVPLVTTSFSTYSPFIFGAILLIAGLALRGTGIVGLIKKYPVVSRHYDKWEDYHRTSPANLIRDMKVAQKSSLILIDNVSKTFGGIVALDQVSMKFAPGTISAIIGGNGSGKTTLLNLISGFYRADSGAIKINDLNVTKLQAWKVARLGIARTFQTPKIPAGMSVLEVVAAGKREAMGLRQTWKIVTRRKNYRESQKDQIGVALEVLELLGLENDAGKEADKVPLGTRRLIEVARALASRCGVICLDEPAAGLEVGEVDELAKVLINLRGRGITIVLVEHNIPFVERVADTIIRMKEGKVIGIEKGLVLDNAG